MPQNDRSGLIDHVYEVNDAANTCEREFIQIDVGYCIAQNNFVRVLTTCFNEKILSLVYSKERLTPWARQGQNGERRRRI